MAAARKLQAEIDRTLKKVQEGIEVFDEIWDKVHDTENANQKEKFEADLKTAIKKLQRHRDQIKTWISSADIKDKTVLVEARKSIEREMERFKVCEKEAKTKAFSKAGLGLADKLDPKEEAKAEAKDWVNTVVSTLQVQVEELEYELEELQANVKKKQKPPPRAIRIEEALGRNKEHMTRLEQVLRCLDNETICPEEIADLKEDVDTYLNGIGDEEAELEYDNVDDIYALILDKLEAVDSHLPVSATVPKHPKAKGDRKKADSLEDDDLSNLAAKERDKEKDREKERTAAAVVKLQLAKGRSTNVKGLEDEESEASAKPASSGASISLSPVLPTASSSLLRKDSSEASPATTPSSATTPTPTPQRLTVQWALDTKASSITTEESQPVSNPAPSISNASTATANGTSAEQPTANGQSANGGSSLVAWLPGTRADVAVGAPTVSKASTSSSVVKAPVAPPPSLSIPPTPSTGPSIASPSAPTATLPQGSAAGSSSSDPPAPSESNETSTSKPSDTTSGLLKLPVVEPGRPGSKALEFQLGQVLPAVNPQLALQIIDSVHGKSMPQNNDADWNSKRFRPRFPVSTPPSYPRVAPDVVDNPALFRKMDPEALFFAFYYQPDTYQQFLAAQELKRQSWRYHKVHNAWFQRYAEPTLTTDEYEQGTYVYFDYNIMHDDHQTGWCYRRKENFTFRYDALEDELQVTQ